MLSACVWGPDADSGRDTDPDSGTTLQSGGSDGPAGEDTGDTGGAAEPEQPSCQTLPPRQLRLLTRAEYEASVMDLFHLQPREACEVDTHCPGEATCGQDGACLVTSIPPAVFTLPADGEAWSSVHLAGSFNDWAASSDDGTWALVYDPRADTWMGTFAIPEGTHEYKFVLDESVWISDPTNPETTGDFDNSVLDVVAETEEVEPLSLGLVSTLPPESRPAGYPFDNNAEAGLVSATHVEAYMRAGHSVAQLALDTRDLWQPCDPDRDGGCAARFAADVGRRIFRRPLEDDEVQQYAAIAESDGAAVAVEAMLASPVFLYRSEVGEVDGDRFRLTGYEIATSLSYSLVGSTPDDELLEAAESGVLDTAQGVEQHARRLLEDPRARETLGRFAAQWLGVEQIETVDKNEQRFPGMDGALRASMLEETRRFFEHVVFDGSGAFEELLTADYTFADARLGALYGVDVPAGAMGKVSLPSDRGGLLGHASVLGSYAYSDQSSPVRRGLFVRRRVLCQELPDPPPDAGAVPEVDSRATTRERFDQHSSDPACAGCHVLIDPVGFGFEHFDAIGAFRDHEAGKPVDATGTLAGVEGIDPEQGFEGVVELGALLATAPEAPACLARQYFRFAHGRLETEDDACAVDVLATRFAGAEHDLLELFVATLTAGEFRYRR